ncbi:MAG: hypothetical protein ACYDEX_26495, partial [Mobilitalea sp.]
MKKVLKYLALINPILVYCLITFIIIVVFSIINIILQVITRSSEYNTIDKTQISLMLASTASFPVSIVIFAGWYRRLNQMETKIIRRS